MPRKIPGLKRQLGLSEIIPLVMVYCSDHKGGETWSVSYKTLCLGGKGLFNIAISYCLYFLCTVTYVVLYNTKH